MMEVEVEELCTNTVTRILTISPATGLERMTSFWNHQLLCMIGGKRTHKT